MSFWKLEKAVQESGRTLGEKMLLSAVTPKTNNHNVSHHGPQHPMSFILNLRKKNFAVMSRDGRGMRSSNGIEKVTDRQGWWSTP